MNKNMYLALAVVGWLVPSYYLFKFLGVNGLNVTLLLQQLFANDISTFFAVDLVISIVVFWIFMSAEVNRLQMKNGGLYVVATLFVGLSFALPLFLYFRERKLEGQ